MPALSKRFNTDDAREQMLCDKHLGIGLSCVDRNKRIRYPSVSKRAIYAKTMADKLSEEMRVLYVAMTRARDRLIMVYAAENLERDLQDIALRMPDSPMELMTSQVSSAGEWVLMTALRRVEAGELFALCQKPFDTDINKTPWLIKVVEGGHAEPVVIHETEEIGVPVDIAAIEKIRKSLSMKYPYDAATVTPSKQTATQLKGREKDNEAAGDTVQKSRYVKHFRRPAFLGDSTTGTKRGTAMHAAMQYVAFDKCGSTEGVIDEIAHLVDDGFIAQADADLVEPEKIAAFFKTEIGQRIVTGSNVLREFKFSVLEDAEKFQPNVKNEKVLVQGVVDCALIEDDGITVVDFKTDRVTFDTVEAVAMGYKSQIQVYSDALKSIYNKPIKAAMLYFFEVGTFVTM